MPEKSSQKQLGKKAQKPIKEAVKPYKTTPARPPRSKRVKPIHEKSCGIVLFREEGDMRYYLLLHYPSGHWDFAKGHVEVNEDEETTARRELTEETGISKITFIKDYRQKMDYYYRRERKLYHKDVIYFLGKTTESKVKLSHEHQGYAWLPYEDALEQLTFLNAKVLLKKAEKVFA